MRSASLPRRIAVIGCRGQLGAELCSQLGERALPLARPQFDLIDPVGACTTLRELRPAAVINAAAFTQVDLAEREPERCFNVNALPVESLANVCGELDVPFVQMSSDYVFFGKIEGAAPFRESHPMSPEGVYARSKQASEVAAARWRRHLIVRTCGLYGRPATPPMQGRSFVETMLALGAKRNVVRVVGDQHCTPSFVPDVARALLYLLNKGATGTYHVVNGGSTTWYDFAVEVFRLASLDVQVERITSREYAAPAPRPPYSVLDTAKYHELGGPRLPEWQAALADCLAGQK